LEYREQYYRTPETFRRAITCFDSAASLDPTFVLAWTQLAETRAHNSYVFGVSSDLPKAFGAIERATALAQDLPEIQRARGYYYYYGLRDFKSAISAFEQYLDQRPNDSLTCAMLGYINRRVGDWDNALNYISKAIRLNPGDHSVIYNLAITYMDIHQYRQAQLHLNRALQISPEVTTYQRFNAFLQLLRRGDISRAEELFIAYFGRDSIWMSRQAGQPRYRQIPRIFPTITSHQLEMKGSENNYNWFLMHALVERELGRSDRALELYHSAYAAIEEHFNTSTNQTPLFSMWQLSCLGLIHAGLGHSEEAAEIASRLPELYPIEDDRSEYWEALYNAAEIYMYIGDSEAACSHLEEVLRNPSLISTSLLAADPLWQPLHDHPRFRALLREYK